jgi:hypothetical protein
MRWPTSRSNPNRLIRNRRPGVWPHGHGYRGSCRIQNRILKSVIRPRHCLAFVAGQPRRRVQWTTLRSRFIGAPRRVHSSAAQTARNIRRHFDGHITSLIQPPDVTAAQDVTRRPFPRSCPGRSKPISENSDAKAGSTDANAVLLLPQRKGRAAIWPPGTKVRAFWQPRIRWLPPAPMEAVPWGHFWSRKLTS